MSENNDMETSPQMGRRIGRRFTSCNGIICQYQMHEIIEIDIGLNADVSVPDVKPVARRWACEIDFDVFAQQGITTVILSHFIKNNPELQEIINSGLAEISAEEKQALALLTMEENKQKEEALMQDFREMLEEKKRQQEKKKKKGKWI